MPYVPRTRKWNSYSNWKKYDEYGWKEMVDAEVDARVVDVFADDRATDDMTGGFQKFCLDCNAPIIGVPEMEGFCKECSDWYLENPWATEYDQEYMDKYTKRKGSE